mgnify:CR=1 FL=1
MNRRAYEIDLVTLMATEVNGLHRRVAVLGASGLVAQRFQQRLAHHPWFELALVAGSPDTAGRSLGDLPWRLEEDRPELPDLVVQNGDAANLVSQLKKENCQLVFLQLITNGVQCLLHLNLEDIQNH